MRESGTFPVSSKRPTDFKRVTAGLRQQGIVTARILIEMLQTQKDQILDSMKTCRCELMRGSNFEEPSAKVVVGAYGRRGDTHPLGRFGLMFDPYHKGDI